MKKLGAILALSLAAVVACDPGSLPPGEPTGALGFTVRPGAIEYPASDGSVSAYEGLMTLVPVDGCVLGFGSYRTGNSGSVPATWLGGDGCTRLVLGPLPGRGLEQAATAFAATAAVPGADGAVIGLDQWFYRRDRSGEVVRLFRPELDRKVVALARAGRNLVGVGTRPGPGGAKPVAWVSGDEGRTAREIELPSDGPGYWSPNAIAAEGAQVLVAGSLGASPLVWASGDAGETWTVSKVQSDLQIGTVLRVGGNWLLAGGNAAGAVVMTGAPGNWRLTDPAALGDGRVIGGTVDKAGKPVLIGERIERDSSASSRPCSVVWALGAGGWQRGELGCPRDTVSAAASLPDGRVLLASSRDLWIRP
ncbi:hypothetical protein ACIRSS_15700 [Amycolatopsis sp. NPDC101161]|uniref:hypothetical protein n=1 Tax=Amycolatopsis sp. NPDC101161 TaxID=3363940 RepID=UPI0037FEAD8A